MAARSTNTMREFLERLLADVAQANALDDADLPFLTQLHVMIVDKLRDPIKRMEEQGLVPPGAPPQMPQGGPPAGGPSFQGAGGVPGVAPSASMPNPDELRRLIGSQNQ